MFTSVCILVFAIAIAGIRADPTDEVFKNCFHVFHPGSMKCCKSIDMQKEHEKLKECFDMKKGPHPGPGPREGPPPCDLEICIAKQRNYLGSDDGTANKAALKENLEKEMADKPDLLAAIIKNCVDGDVSKYGPTDACELFKIKHCMKLHALQTCEEWDDKGRCNDVKSQLEDCTKVLSK